jgi:hypothetical protein
MNHELFKNSVTAVFRDQEIFVTEKGLKKNSQQSVNGKSAVDQNPSSRDNGSFCTSPHCRTLYERLSVSRSRAFIIFLSVSGCGKKVL